MKGREMEINKDGKKVKQRNTNEENRSSRVKD
jgi:hypothetical protein